MNRYDTYGLALLSERKRKIKDTILYGENDINDFVIAWSGGKDSTALSFLIDLAIPDNNIPRVYTDTGIELSMIRNYVYETAKHDNRVVIIKPSTPIKHMLETDGYPFKSKQHSCMLERYKRIGRSTGVVQYLGERVDKKPWSAQNTCPQCLKYQFTPEFDIKISDKCCLNLKEKPFAKWQKENKRPISIVGVRQSEGGRRQGATCQSFKNGKLNKFQPLVRVDDEWLHWFIDYFNIPICDIYKPPYNFKRTGCKGCPFAKNLQQELDTLEKYFPNERKQCEIIWEPIYNEYRRIGYRLKSVKE